MTTTAAEISNAIFLCIVLFVSVVLVCLCVYLAFKPRQRYPGQVLRTAGQVESQNYYPSGQNFIVSWTPQTQNYNSYTTVQQGQYVPVYSAVSQGQYANYVEP